MQGMAVWVLHAGVTSSPGSTTPELPLDIFDAAGTLVWALGLAIEHVADMQKTRWNANTKSGQQRTWLADGLWAYSRHPNFFGEGLLWWGIAIVAASGLRGAGAAAFLPFLSPLWSSFFLLFTSLMLLEKRLDAKFGGDPAYEQYKQETSVFMLWPRSAAKSTKSA